MSNGSPPNGPRPLKRNPSGRSKRGTHKRNRSRQMNTLLTVLKAVDALGAKNKEFSTAQVRDYAGISASQAYTWLQVLRAHEFVSCRIVKTNLAGDYRWKRQMRIVKVK